MPPVATQGSCTIAAMSELRQPTEFRYFGRAERPMIRTLRKLVRATRGFDPAPSD